MSLLDVIQDARDRVNEVRPKVTGHGAPAYGLRIALDELDVAMTRAVAHARDGVIQREDAEQIRRFRDALRDWSIESGPQTAALIRPVLDALAASPGAKK